MASPRRDFGANEIPEYLAAHQLHLTASAIEFLVCAGEEFGNASHQGQDDRMAISFEEFKAESLADPEVRRKHDALASEFEAFAE
ncbi:MAG: hypothetical protein WA815_03270 [Terracidiphilus sp.]